MLRHFVAGLSAHAAGFRAALHHLITLKAVTVLGAALAHFCAHTAGVTVEVRPSQHEIRAGLADFRAI